jgi:hypothetical protein
MKSGVMTTTTTTRPQRTYIHTDSPLLGALGHACSVRPTHASHDGFDDGQVCRRRGQCWFALGGQDSLLCPPQFGLVLGPARHQHRGQQEEMQARQPGPHHLSLCRGRNKSGFGMSGCGTWLDR